MNFIPLGNRVLVEKEKEQKTTSGIILSEASANKPTIAKVLAIGDGVTAKIQVGDNIYHGKYSGTEVMLDTQTYLVVNVDEVLGIVKDTQ